MRMHPFTWERLSVKRVSIAGSCAVSIALVLTLWGSAPSAQATAPRAQVAAAAAQPRQQRRVRCGDG